MDLDGIINQINKEDKYSLASLLAHMVPANTFLSHAGITYDMYKKAELKSMVLERSSDFIRLRQLETYKQFFQ